MARKYILNERQYKLLKENLEDEANYPKEFDLQYFNNLNSFAKRVQYCNQKLYRLASGSARIVYMIDNETVLKLAKNRKGIAQNEVEAGMGEYYDLVDTGIFAAVYAHDERNLWIEMEFARRSRQSDFRRLIGVDFKTFCQFVDKAHGQYTPSRTWRSPMSNETFNHLIESNDFFNALNYYLSNYQPDVIGDLKRISSWGVAKRDSKEFLTLIDFGLNDDTYDKYYG
jgi:mRNA-degrading endonuclease RelE of RelBE toxin-antitoxin system